MAKLACVLFCLVLIHTGYALQCYNCVSSQKDKNCDDMTDTEKVSMATCGKAASSSFVPACIKKVIEDKTTKMMNTTRACIITKNDGSSDECKPSSDRVNVVTCEVCTEDLCNSSENLHFNLFTMLGSISLYFLIKNIN